MNRLSGQKSLYLRQHTENPVQWYPWSEEAFQRAKDENRLIFLSIGYSSCHWCHVMERECFEDEQVAELLNRDFLCIKVDREERPDVDDVFMTVCQAMTGRGGWPLSIFLTPEAKPFFSATYIPKRGAPGYPGMLELLPKIAELWKQTPEMILKEAERIYQTLKTPQPLPGQGQTRPDPALPERLYGILKNSYDPEWGGFGSQPKFPMASNLLFLTDFAKVHPDSAASDMLGNTLYRMTLGGIRDHVGGGFHRYSTDRYWRLPHFEKMLYDQALLLEVYSTAYSQIREPLFLEVTGEIVEFLREWFLSEEGPFYTALDADTEGKEGGYYLWTKEEITKVLGTERAEQFCRLFDIRTEGNFLDEATKRLTGENIIYLKELPEDKGWVKEALKELYDVRKKRTPPALDKKVLCDLNGLTISALCRHFEVSGMKESLRMARRAGEFFLGKVAKPLGHCYYDAEAYTKGGLSDYASLARALIDVYSLTGESGFLTAAENLLLLAIECFYDRESGVFRAFRPDPNLIDIPTDPFDSVLPSGVSLMLESLFRIYSLNRDGRFKEVFDRALSSLTPQINEYPQMYTYLVRLLLREGLF